MRPEEPNLQIKYAATVCPFFVLISNFYWFPRLTLLLLLLLKLTILIIIYQKFCIFLFSLFQLLRIIIMIIVISYCYCIILIIIIPIYVTFFQSCLRNCIDFVRDNFARQAERDLIMRMVLK
jgi:hypothetical protein